MASLYEKANWAADLVQFKAIEQRMMQDKVGIEETVALVKKYHRLNDNFTLTDIWAALVVPQVVRKVGVPRLVCRLNSSVESRAVDC